MLAAPKSMATAHVRTAIAQPACQECTQTRAIQTAEAEATTAATTAAATQTARRKPIANRVHPAKPVRHANRGHPVTCGRHANRVHPAKPVRHASRGHPVKCGRRVNRGHRARLHSMRTARRSCAHPMTDARAIAIAADVARVQKVTAPLTQHRPHRLAAMLNSAGAHTP